MHQRSPSQMRMSVLRNRTGQGLRCGATEVASGPVGFLTRRHASGTRGIGLTTITKKEPLVFKTLIFAGNLLYMYLSMLYSRQLNFVSRYRDVFSQPLKKIGSYARGAFIPLLRCQQFFYYIEMAARYSYIYLSWPVC